MSLGYAEKLSYIEDVGKVGMAEYFDSARILQEKVGLSLLHSHSYSFVFVFFKCASSLLIIVISA